MAATVRDLLRQSADAVHHKDVSAIVELYHPNAALYVPGADLVIGTAAITGHFARVLSEQPADVEHEVTEERLHEVTPDVALVDTVGITRWGTSGNSVEGFTMVAIRDDSGNWLWAGIRATLVPKQTGPVER